MFDDSFSRSPLSAEALEELAALARAGGQQNRRQRSNRRGSPLWQQLGKARGPVFAGLRQGGQLRAVGWAESDPNSKRRWGDALCDALKRLKTAMSAAPEHPPAAIELALLHEPRRLSPWSNRKDRAFLFSNAKRGLLGLKLSVGSASQRWTPFDVLAANRGARKLFERFCEQRGISEQDLQRRGRVTAWKTLQYVIPLRGDAPASPMYRGTRIVAPAAVTRANVELLTHRLGDYLFEHVGPDGALTYLTDPALGEDIDGSNNMIRQWMATCAMSRHARFYDQQARFELVARNIRHNLERYYVERPSPDGDGTHGVIEFNRLAKLGAIALSALAIYEHPERAAFADAFEGLRRTVRWMWEANGGEGSFYTLYRPLSDEHARNFYPGEALLLWAFLYQESRDPALLERIMKSMRFYRDWHRKPENRKPAFIPWHAQAYYVVWQHTRDPELRDWIFEMSDWLLSMQRVRARFPDAAGQFYDPKREEFGPPHSSSTGVYIEGLIDAFALARELGDEARRERYREAIVRGIRNIMQLTYLDPVEAWYGFDPARVIGGVRSNIYNNRIRCDNVQHNLMGILKVLERFEDADFDHPAGSIVLD